jgi:two-component system, chemotaxis family, response regulator Rcp1
VINATQREPLDLLLIEDNVADARIIEICLQEIPLATQLVRMPDGDAALAYLRRLAPYTNAPRPDVILLDLHLPKTDGFEVLDEISKDPQLQSIPVVVCLGSLLDEERLKRYALPADCIFHKSYNPEGLLRVLTRCPKITNKAA